eukprot:scaffold16827_cov32-Tisochrysis_lutea.AAC.1
MALHLPLPQHGAELVLEVGAQGATRRRPSESDRLLPLTRSFTLPQANEAHCPPEHGRRPCQAAEEGMRGSNAQRLVAASKSKLLEIIALDSTDRAWLGACTRLFQVKTGVVARFGAAVAKSSPLVESRRGKVRHVGEGEASR